MTYGVRLNILITSVFWIGNAFLVKYAAGGFRVASGRSAVFFGGLTAEMLRSQLTS